MTVVTINVRVPGSGANVAARGSVRWEPTARRVGAAGELILPQGFHAHLVAGQATVEVEPSTSDWVWCVTELFTGQPSRRRYLAVPSVGPTNYTDLVPVDPVSLDPDLTLTDGGGPGTLFEQEPLLDGGSV